MDLKFLDGSLLWNSDHDSGECSIVWQDFQLIKISSSVSAYLYLGANIFYHEFCQNIFICLVSPNNALASMHNRSARSWDKFRLFRCFQVNLKLKRNWRQEWTGWRNKWSEKLCSDSLIDLSVIYFCWLLLKLNFASFCCSFFGQKVSKTGFYLILH